MEKGVSVQYKYLYEYPFLSEGNNHDVSLVLDFGKDKQAFDEHIEKALSSINTENKLVDGNKITFILKSEEYYISDELFFDENKIVIDNDNNTIYYVAVREKLEVVRGYKKINDTERQNTWI